MPNSRLSDLYSDAHPEYEEAEEVVPPETESEPTPETETVTEPPVDEIDVATSTVIAQSYGVKVFLFAIILALVAWYIRRRRSGYRAIEAEKGIPL